MNENLDLEAAFFPSCFALFSFLVYYFIIFVPGIKGFLRTLG